MNRGRQEVSFRKGVFDLRGGPVALNGHLMQIGKAAVPFEYGESALGGDLVALARRLVALRSHLLQVGQHAASFKRRRLMLAGDAVALGGSLVALDRHLMQVDQDAISFE
jgi:hypothetical protein